jgi:hypothetical protein
MDLVKLVSDAGWKTSTKNGRILVHTPYEDDIGTLSLKHPALLHLEICKNHTDPAVKYQHLKQARTILWPRRMWHDWTGRRFMAHCEGYNYITLAAGASAGKSSDEGEYAILFWYMAPSERNVTIASVTLQSLMTRIWGYVTSHIKEMSVELPYKYYKAPPRILLEEPKTARNKIDDDTLHGMFAVTAQVGDDDQAVATWIGKHPKDKILLILDECTDMPMSILNALPNLNSHPKKFELVGIANSKSTQDLHGLLSTPEGGWDSVTPELQSWKTKQLNGICLYFNPYESPAITDPDPERRKKLGEFLISEEILKGKEKELGTDSEKFMRWVMGFWKSRDSDTTIVSEKFLKDRDFKPVSEVEWSGYYPMQRVAGLDPAFSIDGDKCILRIADVGHSFSGKVLVDFGGSSNTFELKYSTNDVRSLERQLGEQAIDILDRYKIPLTNLAIDVTGQGRAIGEVIMLLNEKRGFPLGNGTPLKIYSMSPHNMHKQKKASQDILPMNSYVLWNTIRTYIEQGSIARLDDITVWQLTNRLIIEETVKGKRTNRLESKKEYKRRMSAVNNPHSPDETDAAALALQVVEKVLGIMPGTVWPARVRTKHDMDNIKIANFLKQKHVSLDENPAAVRIEADFSGGLGALVKYGKPF